MGKANVLGLDPGFASFGWVAAEIEIEIQSVQVNDPAAGPGKGLSPPRQEDRRIITITPLAGGVIRTKKQNKKERVYAADDNLARAREIYWELHRQLDQFQPRAICAESMSFPRSASVAAKMALAWGLIGAESFRRQIPILQVTPQRLKRVLTDRNDASKEEVASEVLGVLGQHAGIWTGLLSYLPKGQHEHMNDALAACMACLDAEAIQLLCG